MAGIDKWPLDWLEAAVTGGGKNAEAARLELARRNAAKTAISRAHERDKVESESVPLAKSAELANPVSDKKIGYIVPE